jgi:ribonuclease HII
MVDKTCIVGIDEIGTGSIVGPFLVGGVRAPAEWSIDGLNDSKQLTDKRRRVMNEKLLILAEQGVIQIAYAQRSNIEIDEQGLYPMLKSAYKEVAQKLYRDDTKIIIDGNMDFTGYLDDYDYEVVVKADCKFSQVMAGSIIGKVKRDDMLIQLATDYPDYDLENCKGYLSAKHLDGLQRYGRTIHHRKSYKLKALGEK